MDRLADAAPGDKGRPLRGGKGGPPRKGPPGGVVRLVPHPLPSCIPMTAAETCELYALDNRTGSACPDVYVLGSLVHRSERVAVVSQQTRAINLAYSLFSTGRLTAGSRVCVIGGGAAGLTAAAYAIQKGAGVTVLESRALLWNLRGCRTRWLHPNLFRYWPYKRWQCTATDFPLMNWYAGYAADVGDFLLSKYRSFEVEQRHAKSRIVSYPDHQPARCIKLDRKKDAWEVSWSLPTDHGSSKPVRLRDCFDVVIAAIGFGAEARVRDTEASVYWLDDTLERERIEPRETRYLISGTGDGGLTDLLRIRIKEFRHHHLRDSLLNLDSARGQALVYAIDPIQTKLRINPKYDPTDDYLDLAREIPFGNLLERVRYHTRAVLTNLSDTALSSPAWPVSRFLAATLLQHDDATTYKPGPVQWKAQVLSDPHDKQQHPKLFQAKFPGSDSLELFEAVVVRHGSDTIEHPEWGPKPISAVDAVLTDFGLPIPDIRAARARWAQFGSQGRITDELIAPTVNEEDRRRSRIVSVLPTVAGRTVLGMLSRLVHTVSPEEGADEIPADKLIVTDWLVSDSAANLVAHVSERIGGGRDGKSELSAAEGATKHGKSTLDWGWRLGAELDRNSAIVAIRGIDDWLQTLWDEAESHLAELERTWILPRPPWIHPPGSLLRHSRVARNWGSWSLRYIKSVPPKGAPPRRRPKAKAAFEPFILQCVNEAAPNQSWNGRTFAVIDLCDLRLRLAVLKDAPTVQVWRLARELSAQVIVFKDLEAVLRVRKAR